MPVAVPHRWRVLGVLLAGGAMDLLDGTIVNVAIPSISRSLHSSYASVEWTVSGYLLAFAVLMITGSRLGDRYGRRRLFALGVGGFVVTSVGCALAPTATVLVTGRILQGLFAAAMVPQILATIQTIFPPGEHTRAVGAYSAVAGLAVMSGPLLAGLLIHWNPGDLGWRAIFLVNAPIGLAVLTATLLWVPETVQEDGERLDLVGVALVSSVTFSVVFALISAHQDGWGSTGSLVLLAAPLLGLAFAAWELRKERSGESPIIPISLLRGRGFALGTVTGCVFFSAIMAFFLSITIFLQLGLGFTALEAASTTIPSAIGLVIAGSQATRFGEGRFSLVAGAVLMMTTVLVLRSVIHQAGVDMSSWQVRPVIVWFGFGTGLILPRLARFILGSVSTRNAGPASGVLNTAMQLGSVLGIVITGMIMFGALQSSAAASARTAIKRSGAELAQLHLPADEEQALKLRVGRCVVATAHQRALVSVPAVCGEHGAKSLRAQRASLISGRIVALAKGLSFETAIGEVLIYEAIALGTVAVLLLLLPTPRPDYLLDSPA